MKAIKGIFINHERINILHQNVTEVKSAEANKHFKCLDCGEEWVQTINSPLIVENEKILSGSKSSWTHNLRACTDF